MAVELLNLFGVTGNMDDISVEIFQQRQKIDILLAIKGKNTMIIIEDKTNTSERRGQIAGYEERIRKVAEDPENEYGIDENVQITTVYFKTGFFYDCDKKVEANLVVEGKDFLEIIEKYSRESEILDCFSEYLKESLEWYVIHGKYNCIEGENFRNWNIARYRVAQYRMMRDIFPENKWDKESVFYEVRHGSNKDGLPWTQLDVMEGLIGETKRKYYIFWRIDTDSKGPYMALRFYDKYDKKDQGEKEERINVYNKHRDQIEEIIRTENTIHWKWDELRGGYTAGYYEATLIIFHMKDALRAWETESRQVIQTIRKINECFISKNI